MNLGVRMVNRAKIRKLSLLGSLLMSLVHLAMMEASSSSLVMSPTSLSSFNSSRSNQTMMETQMKITSLMKVSNLLPNIN